MTYARLRPMRPAILLPIRMNAADTSASSAIADWTPLTVVSRSSTTDEIDTFISDVSTTRTNIAIDSSTASRVFIADDAFRWLRPAHHSDRVRPGESGQPTIGLCEVP